MGVATLRFPARRWPTFDRATLSYTAVLGIVAALVLYPVALVVLSSFRSGLPGDAGDLTLDAWRRAFSDRAIVTALWNTVAISAAILGISFPIAIVVAWVLARTDIPGAQWLEFMFWIGFFLPALPVTLGWILLLDPDFGLVNQLMAALPFVPKPAFDVYSFWGIVWVHLVHGSVAVKVMLLTPAFRNLDASLEEASRVCGASVPRTLARIFVPAMTPVLLVVLVLSVIHSFQSFEIETVLGPPASLFVFSTKIYRLIGQEPPLFGPAMALSATVLGLMLPLIVLQRWLAGRRSYATLGGQFRAARLRLGRWRVPVFLAVLAVALLVAVVPFVFLLLGTFMKLFGYFRIAEPWTIGHWARVLADPILLNSLANTVVLALGTVLIAVVLFTAIAYISVRSRYRARPALDLISWLPSTLPGIILGLGLLWLFLGNPLLRPLYGTMLGLTIAVAIGTMTLGVQIVRSSLLQIHGELEEAARVAGGRPRHVLWHVLLPLLMPVLLLVAAMSFVSAARNVSAVALLATANTRPLALLQLDFMVEGRYEAAAVVGTIVVLLTTGVALAARALGLRVGIRT